MYEWAGFELREKKRAVSQGGENCFIAREPPKCPHPPEIRKKEHGKRFVITTRLDHEQRCRPTANRSLVELSPRRFGFWLVAGRRLIGRQCVYTLVR